MIQPPTQPVVQKFGGSSLSTPERVRAVAQKIVDTRANGRPVVVVVSAMGNTTSQLIERAQEVAPSSPPSRELDMLLSCGERMSMALLAMAIEELGHPAISLTGPQCGILTDDRHTNATILEVRPDRVAKELATGAVVIVAGYQGQSPHGEVTTLGRGGSDTTAVALAGALNADCCEIYSDVPGVYTADPRIVEEPQHLRRVETQLMSEYALLGARVLHPACIDLAARHDVTLRALSTFGDDTHTLITGGVPVEFSHADGPPAQVVGVTSRGRRLRMRGDDLDPELLERTLDRLGFAEGLLGRGTAIGSDVLLDVEDLPDPDQAQALLREELGAVRMSCDDLASVTVVAAGDANPALRTRVEGALGDARTNVHAVYTRPKSISCAVDPEHRADAVRALHQCLVESTLTLNA